MERRTKVGVGRFGGVGSEPELDVVQSAEDK